MANDEAVVHIVLVNSEFMKMNTTLRSHSIHKRKDAWIRDAKKFYQLCCKVLQDDGTQGIYADDIISLPESQLPIGPIYRKQKQLLINYYTSMNGTWTRFGYTGIKSILTCWACVEEWKQNYENAEDLLWDHGDKKRYIAGQGEFFGGSCNITFVDSYSGFASHLPYSGGLRCTGGIRKDHPKQNGLRLRQESDGSFVWRTIHLYKELDILGNFKNYNQLRRKLTRYDGNQFEKNPFFSNLDRTSSYDKLAGYLTLNDTYTSLMNDDIVILEAIARYKIGNTPHVDYIIRRCSGKKLTFSYRNCIDKDYPLGIFFYSKHKHLDAGDLEYFEANSLEFGKGLAEKLGWKSGQLYRMSPDVFTDSEGEMTKSEIDFNKRTDIPFVQKLKEIDPELKLPIISTSLRYVNAYLFKGEYLNLVRDEDTISLTPNETGKVSLFCKFGGLGKNTNITMTIHCLVDKNGTKDLVFKKKSNIDNSDSSFFSTELPIVFHKNRTYKIEFIIDNQKAMGIVRTSLYLEDKRGPAREQFRDNEIVLKDDVQSNSSILTANIRYNLSKKLGLNENTIDCIVSPDGKKIRYGEIVKHDLNHVTDIEEFALPTSRINARYPGLTQVSFPNRIDDLAEKSKLSGRLRSMGVFAAKEESSGEGLDKRSRLWSSYDPHIVKLSKDFHMLFTPKPLTSHIKNPNDPSFIYTDHGTIIKGEVPEDLSAKVPIVERPLFLHHIAESPKQHIEYLHQIINTLGPGVMNRIKQNLDSYFEATHSLTPNGEQIIDRYTKPDTSSVGDWGQWDKLPKTKLSEIPPTKFLIKCEGGEEITFIDILRLERKTGGEEILVVRRNYSDGKAEYLPISRITKDTEGHPSSSQLEWVGDIKRKNITQLNNLYRLIGGKYEKINRERAHDWNFISVDTLRAFSIIANGASLEEDTEEINDFRRQHASSWPEPLRKFCMGGGYWANKQNPQIHSDPMGGVLSDPKVSTNAALSKALIDSVLRWTWYN
jgi:hypothetical protein